MYDIKKGEFKQSFAAMFDSISCVSINNNLLATGSGLRHFDDSILPDSDSENDEI